MHLHLDCASGASGDMLLASLLDAGLQPDKLEQGLAGLGIGAFSLRWERVERGGIGALRLLVQTPDRTGEAHSHAHHRHLADMLRVAGSPGLPPVVRARAGRVFELLARAEGFVHGKSPQEVHFHELSGIDSLVDVIGVCLGLHLLGVRSVSCSTVTVGSGTVRCAHGELPLPAPATLAILRERGMPFQQVESGCELLTPTGAALLAVLADTCGPCPPLRARALGYGAGARDRPGHPNLLRAVLGERLPVTPDAAPACPPLPGARGDCVVELRAALDDITPERVGFMLERCLESGALDAYCLHACMKKSRPGVELVVLSPRPRARALQELLFREGSTLGVRVQQLQRVVLERDELELEVRSQRVRIKRGLLAGEVVSIKAEYDDCARAARALELPLAEVRRLAETAARGREGGLRE